MEESNQHSIIFKENHPCKVIAEIGCNHKGDFSIAKEMIKIAHHRCNVDAVKFQKRCPRECLDEKTYDSSHPNPDYSYGSTYGKHREFLEFDIDKHKQLKQLVEQLGMEYSCSVWDQTSAKEIASLKPAWIKIPSACNENRELLKTVINNFDGEIHVSLGMTTHKAQEKIVSFFEAEGRNQDLILYACTSAYPVSDEDVCILEIDRLTKKFEDKIKGVGFSGHHGGVAVDTAAYILGAEWVERHFTLDRSWKGTDHAASLEPEGMRKVCLYISSVAKAMKLKSNEILPIEEEQLIKLKSKQTNFNTKLKK